MTLIQIPIFLVFQMLLFKNSYGNETTMSNLLKTYFNPRTHSFFRATSFENMLLNTQAVDADLKLNGLKLQGSTSMKKRPSLQRIGFRSNGCTCQQFTCGCCLGINLNQFQINREGCMNFTYDPQEFSVSMDMIMDGNSVFSNSFSAKNPPPLCIPVPIPYIPIQVETCAKLYDIYTPGQNLHMCFDFETRIEKAPVLVLHFDCMRMGNDGVALVKPGNTENFPSISSTTPSQLGSDVYDPVTETRLKQM